MIARHHALPASLRSLLRAAVGIACVASSVLLMAQEIPDRLPPGLDAPPQNLPHVRLISLGGTISGTAKERLNVTNYGAPRLAPAEWIAALPELALYARVTPEDLRPAEGENGPAVPHWMKVARRLQALAADDDIDGIVVTHGTNVMAEVAYFIHLTVATTKPIVFVGAQRPWTGLSGDGPLNLVNAVRVAASLDAAHKGVLQAMNQSVHSARDVTKTSAYRVQTFQSVDLGMLGVADPDIVKFFTEPTRRHTTTSEFNIATLPDALPPVEMLYAYSDAPGYLVDALVEHGVRGIVIDGVGAGALGSFAAAVEAARAQGVIVVATTRTRGGRVQDTPRRHESGVIPGDNLPPEKAKILLQLALTKTANPDELRRIFNEY